MEAADWTGTRTLKKAPCSSHHWRGHSDRGDSFFAHQPCVKAPSSNAEAFTSRANQLRGQHDECGAAPYEPTTSPWLSPGVNPVISPVTVFSHRSSQAREWDNGDGCIGVPTLMARSSTRRSPSAKTGLGFRTLSRE